MTTHSTKKSSYEALHLTRSRYLNLLFDRLRKENVQEAIEEGRRIHTMITYIRRKVKKQETLTPTEVYEYNDYNKETYKIYTNFKRYDTKILNLNQSEAEEFMFRRENLNILHNKFEKVLMETLLMDGKGATEMILKFQKVLIWHKKFTFSDEPEKVATLTPTNKKWKNVLKNLKEFCTYRNFYFHYQSKRRWQEIHRKYQYDVVMNKSQVAFEIMMKLIDDDREYFCNRKYYEDVQEMIRRNLFVL